MSKYKSEKDFKNENRIKWAIINKVSHFAPTISPAPKNDFEIESLTEAIKYYHSKGVKQCIIQPKFMGSYVDIELHKNLEDSRLFSRNGYLINHLDRQKVLQALSPIHSQVNWQNGISKYLIQAELLPWSAMGKGLIEDEFTTYGHLWESHLNSLKNSITMDKIQAIKNSDDYKEYVLRKVILSKEDFNGSYKNSHHLKRTFEAVEAFNILDTEALNKGLETFKNQIDIFGGESENYTFCPFNLLKIYYENGEEFVNDSNIVGYCLFNLKQQNFLTFDFEKTELSEIILHANNFYKQLCSYGFEGVVIKPNEVYLEDVVPMFKVRHNDYLTMIYGIDFKHNFKEYLKKRDIRKKQRSSINQWKISQKMLKINDKDINEDNPVYIGLVSYRILEEELAENIDKNL